MADESSRPAGGSNPATLLPDCPVCGRAIGRIDRSTKGKNTAKRTCPVCKRRFLFTITWHADRPHEVAAERIPDYQKRREQ